MLNQTEELGAFAAFDLHPDVLAAVAAQGYETPTPIQSGVIPVMMTGRDVMGQAQTGTGKTAAFALPILHQLTPGQGRPQALIVTPTRELAMQVARAVHTYGKNRGVRVLAIYGGQEYGRQLSRLRKGIDVVVGTPGRLLDLLGRGALDLSQVRTVVLDEADEMLSMGFVDDIEQLLQAAPAGRQTALFSATLPAEIRRLAASYLTDPETVMIERKQMTVEAVEQRAYLVEEADKLAALTRLFEVESLTSALVFVRTRADSGELANALTSRGFAAEPINGDLSQDARERVLARFRNGQMGVLVATDVAARGLDIDGISHVFNVDLPRDPESYVHRIGRTGRAGKSGVAISLVTPRERGRLRRIERYTRQEIARCEVPTESEIKAQRETLLMEQMGVWLRRGRCQRERELIGALVEEGHDLLEIAAVALKLARADEKQRPIEKMTPPVIYAERERSRSYQRQRPSRAACPAAAAPRRGHGGPEDGRGP